MTRVVPAVVVALTLAVLGAVAGLAGCYPATFQTASVIERGRTVAGLGTGFYYEDIGPRHGWHGGVSVADLYWRAGLGNGIDLGARYSLPSRLMVDARYQLVRRPVQVCIGAGLAYTYDGIAESPADTNHLLDVVTIALVGREHQLGNMTLGYHLGVKPVPVRLTPWQSPRTVPRWGAVVGGSFGGRLKVMPELNAYWGSYQASYPPPGTFPVAFAPCVALQLGF
jgi:hypothetical protein